MTLLSPNRFLNRPSTVAYKIMTLLMIHSKLISSSGNVFTPAQLLERNKQRRLSGNNFEGRLEDSTDIRELWGSSSSTKSINIQENKLSSEYDGIYFECLLSEPVLESACWESVDVQKICLNDSPYKPSKVVHGLSTYSSVVLEPCLDDDFESCVPSELCFDKAKTLLRDVVGVQCLPEPYCDMVTICQTTCGEAVASQKKKHQLESASSSLYQGVLGKTHGLYRDLKRSKSFYYGVLVIIITLGFLARAYFVSKEYDDVAFLLDPIYRLVDFMKSSDVKYSRVKAMDDENDEDQEMVSLKANC